MKSDLTIDDLDMMIEGLKQCAKENKDNSYFTGQIIVSDICTDISKFLEGIRALKDNNSSLMTVDEFLQITKTDKEIYFLEWDSGGHSNWCSYGYGCEQIDKSHIKSIEITDEGIYIITDYCDYE